MHRAVVFVNFHKEHSKSVCEEIRLELEQRGAAVHICNPEDHQRFSSQDHIDIVFSLGGDGTVLYAARMFAATTTPILPVHLGTVGFLAGVEKNQWLTVYEQWLKHQARISLRCMLEFFVERAGQLVYQGICLNDVVTASQGIAKLIRLQVKTELNPGELADIGSYRCDGLIIATPTGSTGYSMAAGGPVLDPEMEALIVTPICSFNLAKRPLVLPSRQPVMVSVESEQRSGVLLTVDGQDTFKLEPDDILSVRHSPHYARLISVNRSLHYWRRNA